MRSPFPGMDPYVEHPGRWQSFHSRFIVEIARAIESDLSPQYYVEVEARTYEEEDAEGRVPILVVERYLEIREISTDRVITAIELLSPVNKKAGRGQLRHEKKRKSVLSNESHFVEIDLLRKGESMPLLGQLQASTYRILVSRSPKRPDADLYSVDLWQPLPELPIPLTAEKEAVTISLQTAFENVYRQARYAQRTDYSQPPPPPFTEAEQQWMNSQKAL
ncbi:MAG: DUF4058 family protein [Cyanobacteria bacterium P01_D01_bin.36]